MEQALQTPQSGKKKDDDDAILNSATDSDSMIAKLVEKHVSEVEQVEAKWEKDINDLRILQKKEYRNFVREYSTNTDNEYVVVSGS